jgi:flagellar biosynthetic protein FliQ
MTPETVIDIVSQAIEMGGVIAAPVLLAGLVIGLVVSIFQAATQINDQTLVFVPKVLVSIVALVLFGSWMLQMYVEFTRHIFLLIPTIGK